MTKTPDEQQVKDAIANLTDTAVTPEPSVPASNSSEVDAVGISSDPSLAEEAMHLIAEHKGKLAIGVAATLGLMVFYRWREKHLAKADPEEYAQLQRLKAVVRQSEDQGRTKAGRKTKVRDAQTNVADHAANTAINAQANENTMSPAPDTK